MSGAPIQSKHRETMNAIASGLDSVLNGKARRKTLGFALFVFEFGNIDANQVNYISNADRPEMLTAVREWLARTEGLVIAPSGRQ